MTMVCKLVSGNLTVNLITGPEAAKGWRIQSWLPKAPVPDLAIAPGTVTERIDLLCDAASHNSLATYFQNLDQMRRRAAAYKRDQTAYLAVYFHAKMDNETGERRTLVREIRSRWRSTQIDVAGGAQEGRVKARLELDRAPPWEPLSGLTWPALAQASGACLTYDYTGGGSPHDIVGDLPARIRWWAVYSDSGGSRIGRLWVVLRSNEKHNEYWGAGDLSNFVSIWELEDTDATLGTDAARAADGTASPGGGGNTKVTVTPGTATWENRLEIELGDVAGSPYYNLGHFLWLLRYQLSAGSSTWEAQLRFGYAGMADADFVQGPIRELANTSWDYIEMDEQLLPVRGRSEILATEDFNAVQVWARRTSGAANLDLDCLIPLTIDEGWLKITEVDVPAASAGWLGFGEDIDGRLSAYQYDASGIQARGRVANHNFRLPIGDGRMYIVYAGPTDSDLSTGGLAVLASSNGIYERWANLRGAE